MAAFKIFLISLTFFIPTCMNSQKTISVTQLGTEKIDCDVFLGTDNQLSNYSIKNNILTKNDGVITYQYNNLSFGKITQVDFQNPLQIIVFYKNFNIVILLDNQLNEIKKIDFNIKSTPVALEAVALSSQNQIWFYDSISSKIGLYNVNTDSFKWISTVLENSVLNYKSDYTHFYWTNVNLNFYRISIYGTIEKLGDLTQFNTVQFVDNGNYIYQYENELFYFDLHLKQSTKIPIQGKIASNFFFRDGILSIFTQKEITNYKIIIP